MSEIEPHSQTWRAVREWAQKRLEENRANLEVRSIPVEQTECYRGAINELKALLALPAEAERKAQFLSQSTDNVD